MLENEIFAGFRFLSEILDEFNFSFKKIGEVKSSFENYIQLNQALHSFSKKVWPDIEDPKLMQQRIHFFLYQGLGNLFQLEMITTNIGLWRQVNDTLLLWKMSPKLFGRAGKRCNKGIWCLCIDKAQGKQ